MASSVLVLSLGLSAPVPATPCEAATLYDSATPYDLAVRCDSKARRHPVTPSDSLTLERALLLARANSPALAAAAAGLAEAEARRSGVRAQRGPRLSLDGVYLRYQDPPALELGAAGSYAPYDDDNFLFELGITQPLFTSGRIPAGIRAAERHREAARLTSDFTEVELTARVAEAHNDALLGRARLELAREAYGRWNWRGSARGARGSPAGRWWCSRTWGSPGSCPRESGSRSSSAPRSPGSTRSPVRWGCCGAGSS